MIKRPDITLKDSQVVYYLSEGINRMDHPVEEGWESYPVRATKDLGLKIIDKDGAALIRTLLLEEENTQQKYILKQALRKDQRCITPIQKEIDVLKLCKHPCIPKLVASGSHANYPWVLREYAEGSRFSRAIMKELNITQTFTLFEDICSAIAHMHKLGITHGNITTHNIIIKEAAATLIGFGSSEIYKRINREQDLYTKINTYKDLYDLGRLSPYLFSEIKEV